MLISASASASGDWGPDHIEIACANEDACIPDEKRLQLEGYADEILGELKKMGFAPPASTPNGNRLGIFAIGRSGETVIQFHYDSEISSGFASSLSPCLKDGGWWDPDGRISLGSKVATFPPHIVYWFLAHEMMHAIQYGQPAFASNTQCNSPDWVLEGMANATAIWLMEKHFGRGGYLPPLSVRAAESRYGLRPYYIGLATEKAHYKKEHRWVQSGTLGYRSSSFWRFIADRYHRGDMGYVVEWLKRPLPGGADWLAWLNESVRFDSVIRQHLYFVFPEFQANFASWVPEKFPNLDEKQWLEGAYEGCKVVALNPNQPLRGLLLEMEPISARCIRVQVSGVEPKKVVSIKLIAYDDDPYELENLHVGAVKISPKLRDHKLSDFNCYRDSRGKGRQPTCIDKPFTGERGKVTETATSFARTWLNKYQSAVAGSIENVYVITHTPLKPKDREHSGRKKQTVRLNIGLETTQLETSESGKAKQSRSYIDGKAMQPIPMRGSEELGITTSDPDSTSKRAFNMGISPVDRIKYFDSGITQVNFMDRSPEDLDENSMAGSMSFSFSPKDGPIQFGATGKFPAKMIMGFEMTGVASMESIIIPVPDEQKSGSIRVVAFNDELLHLEVKGYYCRATDLKKGRCKKIRTVKGTIKKPFGWAYDGAQQFVSIDTPGMAAYRELISDALYGSQLPGIPGIPGIPGAPSMPGAMGGMSGMGGGCVTLPPGIPAGAMGADVPICGRGAPQTMSNEPEMPDSDNCSCTCDEMEAARADAEAMSDRAPGNGGIPDMSELNTSRIMCVFQCAAQYAECD